MKIGGVVPACALTVWLLVLTLYGTAVEIPDTLRSRIAILKDSAAGVDAATADAVADALRQAKFEVTLLSAEAACDPSVLSARKYFLYVIPNAGVYPEKGQQALADYLRGKGSLLILGTPVLPGKMLVETFSPAYKLYPLKDIAALRLVKIQGILSEMQSNLPVTAAMSSCYSRPEGKGFERGYKWRWIPLIKAYDGSGRVRGTVAWMFVHNKPLSEGAAFDDAVRRLVHVNKPSEQIVSEGSVCAFCAISDNTTLKRLAATKLFVDMAQKISEGVFISHAGSREFSYWPGENVELGGAVVNYGTRAATMDVRVRVCVKGNQGKVFEKAAKLIIEPGQTGKVSFEWITKRFDSQDYVVTTELLREGRIIDVIEHEMGVLSTDKPARDAYVTVKDGNFWLEGKKWFPIGANYWPRSTIALEQEDYVYHWLRPGFYDPEEVDGDLGLLESMGANFVAIRINHQTDRRTALDFLRRCRNHGIHVLAYLQTYTVTDEPIYFQGVMTPFGFQKENVAEFFRATHIADNPTLMGWDLVWEPNWWVFSDNVKAFGWGKPNYRQRWDKDWEKWINERYGSLANAEADWGVPVPRKDGIITSPSADQLVKDGPWRVMVCAYRRFMADLMNRHWNNAKRELRWLDPNHLISYRQGNLSPFDFTLTSTHKHVDFFAMEGYDFKPHALTNAASVAGFINRYIPFITRRKPYMWIEYGHNAWDDKTMAPGPVQLETQMTCHEVINKTAYENGANGLAPWWMAGGYRISEKSDYGIFNSDGTLRESGESLRKYGALIKASKCYPEPDTWFTMDSDAHSGGMRHVARNDGAYAYREAVAMGKHLGVRTAGTGTTSSDTPLLAVGNTKYNGKNPPKYLNAEFNWFRIKCGDGEWINVADGTRIRVPGNKQIVAVASVGNLQEATWLTPASCNGKPGAVYMASVEGSGLKVRQPILKDTPYLEDAEFGETFVLTKGVTAETKVELQMTAEGRAWFGEKLRFTLAVE